MKLHNRNDRCFCGSNKKLKNCCIEHRYLNTIYLVRKLNKNSLICEISHKIILLSRPEAKNNINSCSHNEYFTLEHYSYLIQLIAEFGVQNDNKLFSECEYNKIEKSYITDHNTSSQLLNEINFNANGEIFKVCKQQFPNHNYDEVINDSNRTEMIVKLSEKYIKDIEIDYFNTYYTDMKDDINMLKIVFILLQTNTINEIWNYKEDVFPKIDLIKKIIDSLTCDVECLANITMHSNHFFTKIDNKLVCFNLFEFRNYIGTAVIWKIRDMYSNGLVKSKFVHKFGNEIFPSYIKEYLNNLCITYLDIDNLHDEVKGKKADILIVTVKFNLIVEIKGNSASFATKI